MFFLNDYGGFYPQNLKSGSVESEPCVCVHKVKRVPKGFNTDLLKS